MQIRDSLGYKACETREVRFSFAAGWQRCGSIFSISQGARLLGNVLLARCGEIIKRDGAVED
jgi:hypothetical protein